MTAQAGDRGPPRVLLDECVPRRLQRELLEFAASDVVAEGWGGRRNGALLDAMREAGFTVLVTVDRNLAVQQNVAASGVAIVVLRASSNRLADLLPLVAALRDAVSQARPGQVVHVGA